MVLFGEVVVVCHMFLFMLCVVINQITLKNLLIPPFTVKLEGNMAKIMWLSGYLPLQSLSVSCCVPVPDYT